MSSQKDLLHYFRKVADASPLPLYIYDLPQATKVKTELATMLALSEHPHIAGAKCSHDPVYVRRLYDLTRDADFEVFSAQSTNEVLSIVTHTAPLPEKALLLGPVRQLDELGVKTDFDKLGKEGSVLKTVGSRIVICGGRPRGPLYGVYEILDRFVGCRFFTPNESRVPQHLKLAIPLEMGWNSSSGYQNPHDYRDIAFKHWESPSSSKDGPAMSRKVQWERMLPHELEAAVRGCPVAYIPFGSLEWHGKHLPAGTDSLKAYGLCILAARRFGGVVLPVTYWGRVGRWHPWTMPDFGETLCEELYTVIFRGVAENGFKVAIGITGHNDPRQTDLVKNAAAAIQAETGICAVGMNEYDLCQDKDVGGDHAAKWETSFIMALEPDLVEMDRIADDDIETGRHSSAWWQSVKHDVIAGIEKFPDDHPYKHRNWLRWEPGIEGLDPRVHASPAVGAYAADQVVQSLGALAAKLLAESDR